MKRNYDISRCVLYRLQVASCDRALSVDSSVDEPAYLVQAVFNFFFCRTPFKTMHWKAQECILLAHI